MQVDKAIAKFCSIRESDEDKARWFLLEQAYWISADEELQKLYCSTFARPKSPSADLGTALKQLAKKDTATRRKAARKILAAAVASWAKDRKRWLADPRIVEELLGRVHDDDEKVQRDLIVCLGMIARRYEYLDLRIRDALLSLYDEVSAPLKLEIVEAIGPFGSVPVWNLILSSIDCKPKAKAQESVGFAISCNCRNIRSKKILQRCHELMVDEFKEASDGDAIEQMVAAVVALRSRGVESKNSLFPAAIAQRIKETETFPVR